MIRQSIFIMMASLLVASGAHAQDKKIDLYPKYQPREQTPSERLQNFKTPSEPAKDYPRLSNESGEPRLHLDKDHSLGGKVGKDGVEGNVQFPLPD